MRKTEMRSLVWRKYTWEKTIKNIKTKRDIQTAQLTRTSVTLTRWLRRTEQEYLKTEVTDSRNRINSKPATKSIADNWEKPKSTRRKNSQKNSRDWFNNRSNGFRLESSLKWQSFFQRGSQEEQGLPYAKELQNLQKQEGNAHRIGKGSGSESRKPCSTYTVPSYCCAS